MEKQLLDFIQEGKVDEIAAAMIAARLKIAGKALDELMHSTTQKLDELYEQYGEEYRILGSTVVLYYKDHLFAHDHKEQEFEAQVVCGPRRYVEQIRDSLIKKAGK